MKLIKLRTTESTNSFLKELAKDTVLESFTVAITDEQTNGRGQVHGYWNSEPFKNLTFSVFVKFKNLSVAHQKYLNFAVSLTILEVLHELKLPKLVIKWPNDILSENKKICGILIENQLKQAKIRSSVIGIGLNVNQTTFKDLPNATSIKNSFKIDIDLEVLLKKIIDKLKVKINILSAKKYTDLEEEYLNRLYRFQKPSMFKDKNNLLFMAKIAGISSEGKVKLELENEIIKEFGLKEIKFV